MPAHSMGLYGESKPSKYNICMSKPLSSHPSTCSEWIAPVIARSARSRPIFFYVLSPLPSNGVPIPHPFWAQSEPIYISHCWMQMINFPWETLQWHSSFLCRLAMCVGQFFCWYNRRVAKFQHCLWGGIAAPCSPHESRHYRRKMMKNETQN